MSVLVAAISLAWSPASALAATQVSYWQANGNVLDTLGASPPGTLTGTYSPTALEGDAFHLSGSPDYVSIPNDPSQNITGAISMTAWIYPTSVSGTQSIMGKYDTHDTATSYSFFLVDGNLEFLVTSDCNSLSGNWAEFKTTGAPIQALTGEEVGAEFDPANQVMSFLVNGTPVNTVEVVSGSQPVTSICQSSQPLSFGRFEAIDGTFSGYFTGNLDDLTLSQGLDWPPANASPVLLSHGTADSGAVPATFAGGALCGQEIDLPCIPSDFSDYTTHFAVRWASWWNPTTQATYYTFSKYTVIISAPGAKGKIYAVFASADVNNSKVADLLPEPQGPSVALPNFYFYKGGATDATEYPADKALVVSLRGLLDVGWDVEAGANPPALPNIPFYFEAIAQSRANAAGKVTTGQPPAPPPPRELPTRYVASTTTLVPKPGCVRLPSGSTTCRSAKLPRVIINGAVTRGIGHAILQVASSKDRSATSRLVEQSAASLIAFRHFLIHRSRHAAGSISRATVHRFAAAQLKAFRAHPKLDRISGFVIPEGQTPHQFFLSKRARAADRRYLAERSVILSITKKAKTSTGRARLLRTWFAARLHHNTVRVTGLGRFRLVARLPVKLI